MTRREHQFGTWIESLTRRVSLWRRLKWFWCDCELRLKEYLEEKWG